MYVVPHYNSSTSHYLPSLQHRCFHTFNVPSSHPPPTGCVRHLSGSSLEVVCQLQYKTILPKMDWCLPDVICHLEGMGKYTQEIWLMLSKCVLLPPKQRGCHHKPLSIQDLLEGPRVCLEWWKPCKESN